MEVCRACLASEKSLMPLSESFINGYKLLTNIDISPFDGMPQCACDTCMNSVNNFIEFRNLCVQSESSLQEQLLKNVICKLEECDSDQNSPEASSEKNYDSPPNENRRGRPKKNMTISETENQNDGRPRKNETMLQEVKKTVNPAIKNSSSEKLSMSQIEHSVDLDFIKKEYEYEYLEIDYFDLDSNVKAPSVTSEPNIPDKVFTECAPHVLKPQGKQTLKKLKATKNSVVNKTDIPNAKQTQKKLKTTTSSMVTDVDLPCGLCKKVCETWEFASSHLEEHKNDTKCGTCEAPFSEWQALLAHRIQHLPYKYHCCHICLKRLHSVESFEYHYLSKHSNKNLQDITIQCKICMKPFSTLVKLRKHMGTVHSTKKYICDYCSKSCSSRNSLKVHLRQHSNVKNYKCVTCGDSFKQSTSLKAHIWRKHTATRVYCPCCHRVYPDKEALKTHVCPQTAKVCPVCGKVFARADRLNKHMKSHSSIKFKCEQCPAEFKTRLGLAVHSNRHSGDRPHACTLCPKRFYSACLLTRHKRIHTGERPYVCKVCSKAFNSNYNLKIHMRVHGEYLVAHRNKNSDDDDTGHRGD